MSPDELLAHRSVLADYCEVHGVKPDRSEDGLPARQWAYWAALVPKEPLLRKLAIPVALGSTEPLVRARFNGDGPRGWSYKIPQSLLSEGEVGFVSVVREKWPGDDPYRAHELDAAWFAHSTLDYCWYAKLPVEGAWPLFLVAARHLERFGEPRAGGVGRLHRWPFDRNVLVYRNFGCELYLYTRDEPRLEVRTRLMHVGDAIRPSPRYAGVVAAIVEARYPLLRPPGTAS